MKINKAFIGRRWMEFTLGHSRYLYFLMGFSNFILIAYNFIPFLKELLPLYYFVLLFLFTYVPIAIFIGYMHKKSQFRLENKIATEEQPYRDQIVKGKEEMQVELSIFNLDIMEKLMEQHNAILKALRLNDDLMFRDELDKIKEWKKKLRKFRSGVKASELI